MANWDPAEVEVEFDGEVEVDFGAVAALLIYANFWRACVCERLWLVCYCCFSAGLPLFKHLKQGAT